MASSNSARKRIRQNATHRARNRWRLRTMRNAIKEFNQSLAQGSVEQANEALRKASQIIDRTAQKGVIHKNQAARRKSRLSARLKARAAS
ncbi:MAG: 30S ribosomal protein S20 [Phycisphaerales bacterium JB039]